MWRLVFSKYKLKKEECDTLMALLEEMIYSCGLMLKDLNLSNTFQDVEIRDHECFDLVEKLYYSAKYEPICIYCSVEKPYTSSNHYPQCSDCLDKPLVSKKNRK